MYICDRIYDHQYDHIYDHRYLHCDVLVVGGGISGIIAAKTSAQNNKNTILLDDKPIQIKDIKRKATDKINANEKIIFSVLAGGGGKTKLPP